MTTVIFRQWLNSGSIIAIFPTLPANPGHALMYEHVGQHGEGDMACVIAATEPATPAQYADLATELQRIGYSLHITIAERWQNRHERKLIKRALRRAFATGDDMASLSDHETMRGVVGAILDCDPWKGLKRKRKVSL